MHLPAASFPIRPNNQMTNYFAKKDDSFALKDMELLVLHIIIFFILKKNSFFFLRA